MHCGCWGWLLQGNAVRKASAAPSLRIDALRREYERTRAEMESQAHKAAKLDKKCNILVAGLQQRDNKLRTQLDEVAQQVSRQGPHLGTTIRAHIQHSLKCGGFTQQLLAQKYLVRHQSEMACQDPGEKALMLLVLQGDLLYCTKLAF